MAARLKVRGVPLVGEVAAIGSNAYAPDYRQRSRAIEHQVEAYVQIDMDWLRRMPWLPRLEAAGVRYKKDQVWRDIPVVLSEGGADCKSLVAWRIADLRIRDGIMATPFVFWKRGLGNHLKFHVQVRLPDGRIDDPCRRMGM